MQAQSSLYKKYNKGFIDTATMTGAEWFWGTLIVLAILAILKGYLGVHTAGVPQVDTYLKAAIAWYAGIEIYVRVIAYLFSALLVFGIIYSITERNKLYEEEKKSKYPDEDKPVILYANKKWERIIEHLESPHESNWRLAILEADIILDEILDANGYRGATIGDKLKQVDKSDFQTLDFAWEGHKIRNKIAHEGSDHMVSQKEARRVIGMYEAVFKEFKYI